MHELRGLAHDGADGVRGHHLQHQLGPVERLLQTMRDGDAIHQSDARKIGPVLTDLGHLLGPAGVVGPQPHRETLEAQMLRQGGAPAAGPDHRGAHAYVVEAITPDLSIELRGAFFPSRSMAL